MYLSRSLQKLKPFSVCPNAWQRYFTPLNEIIMSNFCLFSGPECSQPKDEGTGKETMLKFFYDPKQQVCVPFFYKGEGGNDNRFNTDKDCMIACSAKGNELYPDEGNSVNKYTAYLLIWHERMMFHPLSFVLVRCRLFSAKGRRRLFGHNSQVLLRQWREELPYVLIQRLPWKWQPFQHSRGMSQDVSRSVQISFCHF